MKETHCLQKTVYKIWNDFAITSGYNGATIYNDGRKPLTKTDETIEIHTQLYKILMKYHIDVYNQATEKGISY